MREQLSTHQTPRKKQHLYHSHSYIHHTSSLLFSFLLQCIISLYELLQSAAINPHPLLCTIYQSSFSSLCCFPNILACLALSASAKPPARLGVLEDLELSGVAASLSTLRPLIAESLGPGMGAGFLAIGRLLGGIGGPGFVLAAVVPFVVVGGGGGGGDRITTAGGGGGGSRAWGSSLR